jgi:hypothetical protein
MHGICNMKNGLRVFETKVLRKIFGPKRDEVTGEWRRLHNEDFHDLHSSPNIIRLFMRWVGHVACVGRGELFTGVLWGNLRE